MNDEQYCAIRCQYKQIEESCYRMGIGVDEYYKLIEKGGETLQQHLDKISGLEKSIKQLEFDWGD